MTHNVNPDYTQLDGYALLDKLMRDDRFAATELKQRYNTTDAELLLYLFTVSNLLDSELFAELVEHFKQVPTLESMEAKLLETYQPLELEGIYARMQVRLRKMLAAAFTDRTEQGIEYAVLVPATGNVTMYTTSLLNDRLTDEVLPEGWSFDGMELRGDTSFFLFYTDRLPSVEDTAYVEYLVTQIRQRYDGYRIDMDKVELVAAELRGRAERVDEEMERGLAKAKN